MGPIKKYHQYRGAASSSKYPLTFWHTILHQQPTTSQYYLQCASLYASTIHVDMSKPQGHAPRNSQK